MGKMAESKFESILVKFATKYTPYLLSPFLIDTDIVHSNNSSISEFPFCRHFLLSSSFRLKLMFFQLFSVQNVLHSVQYKSMRFNTICLTKCVVYVCVNPLTSIWIMWFCESINGTFQSIKCWMYSFEFSDVKVTSKSMRRKYEISQRQRVLHCIAKRRDDDWQYEG